MSGFKKIVVTTLIIASVSIGIGAYIIFESGLGTGEIANEIRNLIGGNDISINLGSGVEVSEDLSYPMGSKEMILVDTPIGDLEVIGYDGDEIKLLVEGNVPERYLERYLKVEESATELGIYFYKDISNLNFGIGSSYDMDITLMIPEEYKEDVHFENVSGEITMEGISARNVRVENISGDIVLEDGEHEEIRFSSVSGQFISYSPVRILEGETVSGRITATGVKETFRLESVSGSVIVTAESLTEDSEISTISGAAAVEIEEIEDLSYDLSSISGKITVDTGDGVNQSSQSLERNVNNTVKVDVSTVSGKISIKY
ncbi:DUF4097 family beta strand repeat-containing protein [Proteiniclasticum sp. C24MP]|uniref:DUF4097 family beta strand repeat-containing protein n=1 Tax=Proteiniclasticum sp. C24MP TaxID=3374101 RepID=UPI0037546DCC